MNAMIGGCSLETHYGHLTSHAEKYELLVNGDTTAFNVNIQQMLLAQDWDYITFQQVSQLSVDYDTFQPYLSKFVAYAREICPDAKILIHETWAYEEGSDRLTKELGYTTARDMYNDIRAAYAQAAADVQADGIIPSGTLFMNMLASGIPSVHRDTSHATVGAGRYGLGLLWYKVLTGNSVANNTFKNYGNSLPDDQAKIVRDCVEEMDLD